jgi:hypothetical protein
MVRQLALVDPTRAGRSAAHVERRRPETTPLYAVVHEHLESFLSEAERRGRGVPRFVERELRAYLECGLLQFGFVRVRCESCGHGRLVAFSCKGRAFCPSCLGRRMADTAAHLVDRVLPAVPVRQWVLSLPHALRYRLAYDHRLCSAVLRLFIRAVFGALRRRARAACGGAGRSAACGAITFVQRSGDALNLNVHFHSLVLDGVYLEGAEGRPVFRPLPPPTDAEVERITLTVARRLQRLLERRGFFEPDAPEADPLAGEAPLLAELCAASVRGRIATGPHAGQKVLRLGDRIHVEDVATGAGPRCANAGGLSLHANVCAPARDRKRLERLCRYVSRPPIASERLSRLADGRVLYRLKRRWRDGTTHVLFEPLDFLGRLAALVPPPRAHLVRYHGVLAPAARRRAAGVAGRASEPAEGEESAGAASARGSRSVERPPTDRPGARSSPSGSATAGRPAASPCVTGRDALAGGPPGPEDPQLPPRARRLSWAELMRRIFAVDVLECPRCRGRMRIVAAIDQPEVIAKILTHLGLPARAPPARPARADRLDPLHGKAPDFPIRS